MNLEPINISRQDKEELRILKTKLNELILAITKLTEDNLRLKEAIKSNSKGNKL